MRPSLAGIVRNAPRLIQIEFSEAVEEAQTTLGRELTIQEAVRIYTVLFSTGTINMAHTCHATNCSREVPEAMFMCRSHWYSLPKRLRDRIWETYRNGQEDDKRPSHDYCEAAKACVTYVAVQEGIEPDLTLYEVYDPGV